MKDEKAGEAVAIWLVIALFSFSIFDDGGILKRLFLALVVLVVAVAIFNYYRERS
jgi:hypothetical protein